jgi:hypothetical protein
VYDDPRFARPDDASRREDALFMIGYYRRPDFGKVEKVYMPVIDYHDAKERYPNEWSEQPPPVGTAIVDRTDQGLPGGRPHHGAA